MNEVWPWSKYAAVCVDASVRHESQPNVAVCGVLPPDAQHEEWRRDFHGWLVAD